MDRTPHLQKEVLESCTECEGTGLIKNPFTDSICRRCGGFGLIENGGGISGGTAKPEGSVKRARMT